jgi:apoptosis-inducing factor 2
MIVKLNLIFNPLLDKLFIKGNGTLKVGNVVGVVPADKDQGGGSILLEGGESIPFAVLVLTPGSIWEGPVSLPATKDDVDLHFLRWRAKFRDAKHVVLAGGGTVGIGLLFRIETR